MNPTPTPVATIELLTDVDPCMCWRVTVGDLHACGPTIGAAVDIIDRALVA